MTARRTFRTRVAVAAALALAFTVAPVTAAASAPATAPMAGHTRSASNAAASAAAAVDFSSIFTGQDVGLVDSGWSACPTPIEWSVDARQLTEREATREIGNLQWAFDEWTEASGLVFRFAGQLAVDYIDETYAMVPADGSEISPRHIYLAFLSTEDAALLKDRVVGFGSPSHVMLSVKEIVDGNAAFRTDHVKATGEASPLKVRSLYLHELGHVLGLAHATNTANVMYPIVTNHVDLGPGDVSGVRTMTKPCTSATA